MAEIDWSDYATPIPPPPPPVTSLRPASDQLQYGTPSLGSPAAPAPSASLPLAFQGGQPAGSLQDVAADVNAAAPAPAATPDIDWSEYAQPIDKDSTALHMAKKAWEVIDGVLKAGPFGVHNVAGAPIEVDSSGQPTDPSQQNSQGYKPDEWAAMPAWKRLAINLGGNDIYDMVRQMGAVDEWKQGDYPGWVAKVGTNALLMLAGHKAAEETGNTAVLNESQNRFGGVPGTPDDPLLGPKTPPADTAANLAARFPTTTKVALQAGGAGAGGTVGSIFGPGGTAVGTMEGRRGGAALANRLIQRGEDLKAAAAAAAEEAPPPAPEPPSAPPGTTGTYQPQARTTGPVPPADVATYEAAQRQQPAATTAPAAPPAEAAPPAAPTPAPAAPTYTDLDIAKSQGYRSLAHAQQDPNWPGTLATIRASLAKEEAANAAQAAAQAAPAAPPEGAPAPEAESPLAAEVRTANERDAAAAEERAAAAEDLRKAATAKTEPPATPQAAIAEKQQSVRDAIDQVIPPDQNRDVNMRVKSQVDFELQKGNLEGAQAALDRARTELTPAEEGHAPFGGQVEAAPRDPEVVRLIHKSVEDDELLQQLRAEMTHAESGIELERERQAFAERTGEHGTKQMLEQAVKAPEEQWTKMPNWSQRDQEAVANFRTVADRFVATNAPGEAGAESAGGFGTDNQLITQKRYELARKAFDKIHGAVESEPVLPQPVTPAKLTKEVGSDPGYVYHATNTERLQEIADSGKLRTHGPSYGTDQDVWPDGSKEKRAYFSNKAGTVWQFAPEEGTPVVIRTKDAGLRRESTGDVYSNRPLTIKQLEYLGSDGNWHPVASLAGQK